MDIPPHPNLLRALRAERFDCAILAGEAIDNAFDANASKVAVIIDDDAVIFSDDGVGISRDRIKSIAVLGEHGEMSTTQLGRFGVGVKYQAFNAGDLLEIDSISRDGRVRLQIDWAEIMLTAKWQIEDAQWTPVLAGTPTGTRLEVSVLRNAKRFNLDDLRHRLAEMFYPALAEGRQISINGVALIKPKDPALTDIVNQQLMFDGGRSADVRAGILVDAESPLYAVHIGYKHRVIMPRCSLGCNGGGSRRMFARVTLSKEWELGRFKNDLPDDDQRDELDQALSVVLEPILEKCRTKSMFANIENMTQRLNAMLPPDLRPESARPRRKRPPRDEPPPPQPPRTPRERILDDADPTPTGPIKTRSNLRPTLEIDFDGRDADDGVGRFERGTGRRCHRIHLAPDEPSVAFHLKRGAESDERALYIVAISLFVHSIRINQFELDLSDFGKQMARVLSLQNFAAVGNARKVK